MIVAIAEFFMVCFSERKIPWILISKHENLKENNLKHANAIRYQRKFNKIQTLLGYYETFIKKKNP